MSAACAVGPSSLRPALLPCCASPLAAPVQRSQRPHCHSGLLHHQLPGSRSEGVPAAWHVTPPAQHPSCLLRCHCSLRLQSSLYLPSAHVTVLNGCAALRCLNAASDRVRRRLPFCPYPTCSAHNPPWQVIHEKLGIQHGCITTIHDVTNTQARGRRGRWWAENAGGAAHAQLCVALNQSMLTACGGGALG